VGRGVDVSDVDSLPVAFDGEGSIPLRYGQEKKTVVSPLDLNKEDYEVPRKKHTSKLRNYI